MASKQFQRHSSVLSLLALVPATYLLVCSWWYYSDTHSPCNFNSLPLSYASWCLSLSGRTSDYSRLTRVWLSSSSQYMQDTYWRLEGYQPPLTALHDYIVGTPVCSSHMVGTLMSWYYEAYLIEYWVQYVPMSQRQWALIDLVAECYCVVEAVGQVWVLRKFGSKHIENNFAIPVYQNHINLSLLHFLDQLCLFLLIAQSYGLITLPTVVLLHLNLLDRLLIRITLYHA